MQETPHVGGARVRWNRRPPLQSEGFTALPQKKVDRQIRGDHTTPLVPPHRPYGTWVGFVCIGGAKRQH